MFLLKKTNNLRLNLSVYQICCSILPKEQEEMSIKFIWGGGGVKNVQKILSSRFSSSIFIDHGE